MHSQLIRALIETISFKFVENKRRKNGRLSGARPDHAQRAAAGPAEEDAREGVHAPLYGLMAVTSRDRTYAGLELASRSPAVASNNIKYKQHIQQPTLLQDIEALTANFQQLKEAEARFKESVSALSAIPEDGAGREIMVPLTSSLYVPGRLGDTDEVLVDIGTGFYVGQLTIEAGLLCWERQTGLSNFFFFFFFFMNCK